MHIAESILVKMIISLYFYERRFANEVKLI